MSTSSSAPSASKPILTPTPVEAHSLEPVTCPPDSVIKPLSGVGHVGPPGPGGGQHPAPPPPSRPEPTRGHGLPSGPTLGVILAQAHSDHLEDLLFTITLRPASGLSQSFALQILDADPKIVFETSLSKVELTPAAKPSIVLRLSAQWATAARSFIVGNHTFNLVADTAFAAHLIETVSVGVMERVTR